MKKIIINTLAIFALVASVFLQIITPNNTYALVSCDGVTSAARSKCTSMVAACEKQTSQARTACEEQVQKKINACTNIPDTNSKEKCFNAQFGVSNKTEEDPKEDDDDDDDDEKDDKKGGNTSPTQKNSSTVDTPQESSPDRMNHTGDCKPENGEVYTSILGGGGCVKIDEEGGNIFDILNTVLTILTTGVGIAGTLGIVIAGVMYLTAKDNEQQVIKAKSSLINIVIGLAAYAMLWAFLQWLIPGGILNGS